MTNAWENAKQLAEKHASQGGIFVRLQNDGDKVVGVFCGEPYAREVYWDGQKYTESPPEGGGKASLRVSLNFYVPAEGSMKIIEGGTAWFKDVLEVRDKYGLDKWVFEVKRRGKPKDPKTKYSILPEAMIDDALRARIQGAERHDLGAIGASQDGDVDSSSAAAPKNVDLDTARSLADRLKVLPRGMGERFLAAFKIGRIRDLLASDVPAALAFIASLEQPAEVDPFAV